VSGAVPTRPVLIVALGGVPLAAATASTISYALVRQVLGSPAAAELDFAEPGSDLIDRAVIGTEVVLRKERDLLFQGQLAAVRMAYDGAGGRVLRVRAFDPLHTARRRRVTLARQDASAATLGAEIARNLGVTFRCAATPYVHPLLFQTGQSDFELLATLAEEAGLYPILVDGELSLVTLEGQGEPLPMRLGQNLHALTVGVSDEQALRRTETFGWRIDTLEPIRETAALSRQDAFEMHDVRMGADPDGAVRLLLDRIVGAGAQAQGLAQAAMDHAAAAEAMAEGVAEGDPAISPGRPIEIADVASRFCGRYVVTTAVHRFSVSAGYTTGFTTVPPSFRGRDRRAVVTYGTVSDVHDPSEVGRCRVKLASFGELETGWLQNAVPGAGKGRGLACLPELHDTVLVVFPDGDPANGFVLGGLYGIERLPRGVNVRQGRPFVLRTAGGQALELGRDASLARLSTAAGSLVELTPDRLRIASVTDLLIEAPGRSITIRANAINLEQG
jgi:phage baseplate assembly protein gpV